MNPIESALNSTVAFLSRHWPAPTPKPEVLSAAKLVAHRGVHENNLAIENTLPAFRLALEHKIWGIEFDIRMSKDDVPFILHDPDTKRTYAGTNIILGEKTAQEIKAALPDLPKLTDVVRELGRKLHFMIEIKEDYSRRPKALENIYAALASLVPKRDFHLISLQPELLEAFQSIPAKAKLDIIWTNPRAIFRKNYELNHGGLAGHFLFFSSKRIQELHGLGRTVGVGYLDSQNSLYRELNKGVDWVFTNHPIGLRKLLPD